MLAETVKENYSKVIQHKIMKFLKILVKILSSKEAFIWIRTIAVSDINFNILLK